VVSGTSVSEAWRTTHEPSFCRRFFSGEKCSILSVSRSPTTMSAVPATIGRDQERDVQREYWLSASVLTMTSAPSFRHASRPAWKPAPGPCCSSGGRCGRRPPRGHRHGGVRGAVVDDEPLDHVEARDLARQVGDVRGAAPSFVPAGIWMIAS
jgi:hypothetical protein